MPSGYTACIEEGITFENWIMLCARAFGALVMMREEPFDAQIPEKFEPSDYHQRQIQAAKAEIEQLKAMTTEQAYTQALSEYNDKKSRCERRIQAANELRQKYLEMRSKAEAWQPPTPDHEELKVFMLSQITKSMAFDCNTKHDENELASMKFEPATWRANKLNAAEYSIEYHQKHYEEELERVAGRNAWIQALRDSVKPAAQGVQ